MKRIHLLAPIGSYGIYQDILVLNEVLSQAGYVCHATVASHTTDDGGDYDVNLFLEAFHGPSFYGRFARRARKNILIPNAELIPPMSLKRLRPLDAIFTKTHAAEGLFKRCLNIPVHFTSFTSVDRFKPDIERENVCLHVTAGSPQKKTEAVIGAYEMAGETLPPCHLYVGPAAVLNGRVDLSKTPNLTKHLGPHHGDVIDSALNRCLIHLCPSRYEGFGHSLNEAKSVGALVVTTKAPPMNELVRPEFGLLIPPAFKVRLGLVLTHHVTAKGFIHSMHTKVLPLLHDRDRVLEMSTLARADFLTNDEFFRTRLVESLETVLMLR